MILLKLAIQSLLNRKLSTALTVFSISLSVCLLLAVERTRKAAEEGFTQSVSQVDLLVGARTGPINLILYTVFNMGNPTNNIEWDTYQDIKKMEAVEWTIPYSLGDSHKGYRVVATDENFFKYYKFRSNQSVEFQEGAFTDTIWEVVIGSEVHKKLNYKRGDSVVITHGVTRGEGIQKHEDSPFYISGVLKPTGTAIDQSLYISLYGMEAIHMDWKNGVAPSLNQQSKKSELQKSDIKLGPITSFFLRTKSRIQTLGLQRMINTYDKEPLSAIIPGVTLAELWRSLGQIEGVLKLISFMVLGVGLISMMSTLLSGLNERRREMAILRSLGASPFKLSILLVCESGFLSLLGIILGFIFQFIGFQIISHWLESEFGFYLNEIMISSTEVIYLGIIWGSGLLVGLIPALQASKNALKDGLSIKV